MPFLFRFRLDTEENFTGVIDLVYNKAVVWYEDDETGTRYELEEIPEQLTAKKQKSGEQNWLRPLQKLMIHSWRDILKTLSRLLLKRC